MIPILVRPWAVRRPTSSRVSRVFSLLYARTYPDQVTGMVLVDPPTAPL